MQQPQTKLLLPTTPLFKSITWEYFSGSGKNTIVDKLEIQLKIK
jgi:hypothetical protein